MRSLRPALLGGAWAAGLTYLLGSASLTGCEQVPSSAQGARVGSSEALVYLVGPASSCPQWRAIKGGAARYAQRLPYMRMKSARPELDTPEALAATVARVLDEEPVAVCLYIVDPVTVRPVAKQILKNTPILVTMGAPLDETGVFAHVNSPAVNAAELLGRNLPKYADGRRSYLLVHEKGKNPLATQCYRSFMAAASQHPSMSLLEQGNAAGSDLPPSGLLTRMLDRFRRAGVVVTLNPEVWLAASPEALLSEANRFATLGAFPELWPHLRSGRALALAGPLDGEIGFAALELVSAALTKSREFGTQRFIVPELVTAETLDDFARRYAAAAGLDLADLLPEALTTHSSPGSGGR
jgi:ABC-type sugar transport system substrate-binding protein